MAKDQLASAGEAVNRTRGRYEEARDLRDDLIRAELVKPGAVMRDIARRARVDITHVARVRRGM